MKINCFLNLLIPFALFTLAFTSCNQQGNIDATQYTVDTMVNNKVQIIADQLKAQCDSSMIQAARVKADSILKSR